MPLLFSYVVASLWPVYCTSFAQEERQPLTHHVIRSLNLRGEIVTKASLKEELVSQGIVSGSRAIWETDTTLPAAMG